MKNFIDNVFSDSITKLENGKLNYNENSEKNLIIIDKSYFNSEYSNNINITKCKEHIAVFDKLHAIKTPVLYWFEFEHSEHKSSNIREIYEAYRNGIKKEYNADNYRNTSAYKKEFKKDGDVLYVGKVETGFWGRIVTHLGYAQSEKTAGMQLFHWYDVEKFGNLKLNYIVFEKEMKHLIVILEKELAIKLKPLIGTY